jgi:hypothetical protein
MPATYEPIATQTLSSAATGITFTSIPATYTDLKIVMTPLTISSLWDNSSLRIQFNSDSGTNYSRNRIFGNGSSVSAQTQTNNTFLDMSIGGIMSTNRTLFIFDIFSYAGSTFKTTLATINDGDLPGTGYEGQAVGLWRSTSAITSIFLYSTVANILGVGTTATLYGIKNA